MSMIKHCLAIFIALTLSGCAKNVDGTYTASKSALFGSVRILISMEIKGEHAVISMQNKPKLEMKTILKDDRIVVFKNTPSDGFIFQIKDGGNTLECNSCEQMNLPKIWEKNM